MKVVAVLLLIVLTAAAPAAAVPTSQPGGAAEDFVNFTDPFEEPADRLPEVDDPLEPVNRAAFWANDKVYTYLLQPFCERVPEEIRQAIADGFQWLTTPVRVGFVEFGFAFRDGGSELGRFVARGLLGLLERSNPTASASVAREDFGRAFEGMGMTPGFYLILPVLGPSTLRDGVGRLASVYIDPPASVQIRHEPALETSLSDDMKTYAAIRETALDPYLFIRDAYRQQQIAARKEEGGSRLSARTFFGSDSAERHGMAGHMTRQPG